MTQSLSAQEQAAELSRCISPRQARNILILERGPFMPQEKLNWDTSAVFLDNRYHTKETWQDKDGKDLHPQQAYFVGGQTKVYGRGHVPHEEGGLRSDSSQGRNLACVAHLIRRSRTVLHAG